VNPVRRVVDLVAEPFDVAIRMGKPTGSALIARQLANPSCHHHASGRYLERSGEPRHPGDLTRDERLLFRAAKPNAWTLHGPDPSVEVTVSGRFQLRDDRDAPHPRQDAALHRVPARAPGGGQGEGKSK